MKPILPETKSVYHLHECIKNMYFHQHIDGLVQDCSNSVAGALELLQSCTKPSICQSR